MIQVEDTEITEATRGVSTVSGFIFRALRVFVVYLLLCKMKSVPLEVSK